ncbi:MAG: S24 family peptidase [Candidatus Limiplasma sp.]|nr:S24 family peptidase [Candidatus Limiplasma sp.]
MSINERLKQRREQMGLSIDELASKIEKSRATVYRYESDSIHNLPASVVKAIAIVLKITPTYLMGWDDRLSVDVSYRTPETTSLKERYQIMRTGGFQVAQTLSKPLVNNDAIGDLQAAIKETRDFIDVPVNIECDFVLRCKGDRMIGARVFDGDLVYIRIQPDVEHGEIAAVMINGETTLKRVRKESFGIVLWPENPNFTPLSFGWDALDEFRILGKAVAFMSAIR